MDGLSPSWKFRIRLFSSPPLKKCIYIQDNGRTKKKKKKSLEEKGSLNNFNTLIHKLITYKKSLGEIFSKRGSFTIRNKEIDKMIKI